MIDRMLSRLFRRADSPQISEDLWANATQDFEFIRRLPSAEQTRLRTLATQFIAEHEWTGAGGFELSDEVIIAIAAQACLPVLHLSLDLYARFVGVVVYPSGFLIPKTETDEDGVVHEWVEEASGEAWAGGPVVLSWEDAARPDAEMGYNVVIHEFAHKLDMADGVDDGIPIFDPRFHAGMDRAAFAQTLDKAYALFCDEADLLDEEAEHLWNIDLYAAQHLVEFFAVSVETLLTRGKPPENHALTQWFALLARYLCLPKESGFTEAVTQAT